MITFSIELTLACCRRGQTAHLAGCAPQNLYVQGVNATTGERLGGFTAFDTPIPWVPARAGTPPVVAAKVQAGTTLLH